MILGAKVGCEWAVLPRNSGVFGWCEDAAWRFSARRTWAARLGEKIFKNFLKEGWKTEKLRCERCCEIPIQRRYGQIFGSGNSTSSSAVRAGVRRQRFTPLIYRRPPASSIARFIEVSPLVRSAIPQPSPMA